MSPAPGWGVTFLPVRPRFSTILCKFAHTNFFHSGVTPWRVSPGAVRPPIPLVTPLHLIRRHSSDFGMLLQNSVARVQSHHYFWAVSAGWPCVCSSSVLVLESFRDGAARVHRVPQHELTAHVHHRFAHLHAQRDGDDRRPWHRADAQADTNTDAGRRSDRRRPADQRLDGRWERHGRRAQCRRSGDAATGQDVWPYTGDILAQHQRLQPRQR